MARNGSIFFFKDFGLEEKPNFKKSCDLATSTFDPPKKYRSIFESKKKLDTKKSICGAREKNCQIRNWKIKLVEVVCKVLLLISEFVFAQKSQENASKLVPFSVFPFVQLYFSLKCMLCGLCWNRLGQIMIIIKNSFGFSNKKPFSYIDLKNSKFLKQSFSSITNPEIGRIVWSIFVDVKQKKAVKI